MEENIVGYVLHAKLPSDLWKSAGIGAPQNAKRKYRIYRTALKLEHWPQIVAEGAGIVLPIHFAKCRFLFKNSLAIKHNSTYI